MGKVSLENQPAFLDPSSTLFHCFQGLPCQHHLAPSYQSSPQAFQLTVGHHYLPSLSLHSQFKALFPRLASLLTKILCHLVLVPLGQVDAIFSSIRREVITAKPLLSTLAVQLFVDPGDASIFHQALSPHWKNQGDATCAPVPLAFTSSAI